MTKPKCILAIESSCDDTSAAVIREGSLLSNVTHTQEVHKNFGGVVPELASRSHLSAILPVIDEALRKANCAKEEIEAVAVTRGPGLMGSLLVGVSMAKGLALGWNIPLIEVHHMEAHIMAHFIEAPHPKFPFLCLTVSGGHTQIVRVNGPASFEILGQTLDDAAGEAFDKTGKILGLPYPAGPHIDRLAQEGIVKFAFPKPQVQGLDFSFSGLKTAILYFLRLEKKKNADFVQENLKDICASVQSSIINILLGRLIEAAEREGLNEIAIAGGVSANSGLRKAAKTIANEKSWNLYIPQIQYCTDNAGMIAMAAWFRGQEELFAGLDMKPAPRLPMMH
jgi:N6-L-threonylcarbamoyladenine synthase